MIKKTENQFETAVAETWPINWDWGEGCSFEHVSVDMPKTIHDIVAEVGLGGNRIYGGEVCFTTDHGVIKQPANIRVKHRRGCNFEISLADCVRYENNTGIKMNIYCWWVEFFGYTVLNKTDVQYTIENGDFISFTP